MAQCSVCIQAHTRQVATKATLLALEALIKATLSPFWLKGGREPGQVTIVVESAADLQVFPRLHDLLNLLATSILDALVASKQAKAK